MFFSFSLSFFHSLSLPLMFLMRAKMKLGSCGVINGRWAQRSSLTFSLTFPSSDAPKQSAPHPPAPPLPPLRLCPRAVAVPSLISPISTSSLFDLLMENIQTLLGYQFRVVCFSVSHLAPRTFGGGISAGGVLESGKKNKIKKRLIGNESTLTWSQSSLISARDAFIIPPAHRSVLTLINMPLWNISLGDELRMVLLECDWWLYNT